MAVTMGTHRALVQLGRPVFDSIHSMYETEGGAASRETDFGMHWVVSDHEDWPRWRLSHVDDTELVYAARLSQPWIAVVLAKGVTRDEAEYALQGWADRAAPTLAWAAAKLEQWKPPIPASEPLLFEEATSPLRTSNDGRVRKMRPTPQVFAIEVDGVVVWHTTRAEVVDAFIAGWDARDEAKEVE